MRLSCGNRELHLTYCTNVHPGESLDAVLASLERYTLAVKRAVCPVASFGVGLWIGRKLAAELASEPAFERLAGFLAERDLYVFTANAFPMGDFHGPQVKEGVYRPDWQTTERAAYTLDVARILARLLPEGVGGTISTLSGTFKAFGDTREVRQNMARRQAGVALTLRRLAAETGKRIRLCLEPEPLNTLETTAETVEYFQDQLGQRGREHLMREGASAAEADEALEEHLGVCLDTCHQAVEFEDPGATLDALIGAGIRIGKAQLSAALVLPRPADNAEGMRRLAEFEEPRYLHQVVSRTPGGLTRVVDLPLALRSAPNRTSLEWRIHFHVPIFLDAVEPLGTTRGWLEAVLDRLVEDDLTSHLEVETYSWGVIPPSCREDAWGEDLSRDVTRELHWVLQRIGAR